MTTTSFFFFAYVLVAASGFNYNFGMMRTATRPFSQKFDEDLLLRDDTDSSSRGASDYLLPRQSYGSSNPMDHPYVRGRDDGSVVENEERVHELLSARLDAKKRRDFDLADDIRDELSSKFNVVVWDKRSEWTVGTRRAKKFFDTHDYSRDPEDDSEVDVVAVDDLLLRRLRAKLSRDFELADQLKDELRVMGVRVDDGDKRWRGGVDPGESYATAAHSPRYTRIDSGDMLATQEVDLDEVERLIDTRHQARRRKYWKKADELLDELILMGIVVDDTARTWRLEKSNYEAVGDGFGDNLGVVEDLVSRRRLCKMRKQFNEADRIRSELYHDYRIQVDDQKKTFWVRSGKSAAPSSSEVEEDYE